jgi:hypothetical protein
MCIIPNFWIEVLYKKNFQYSMNILKWTIVVIVATIAVTIVAVTFLVTNSVNSILTP